MTSDDLLMRVCRIYASIDAVQEFDLGKVPAKVVHTEQVFTLWQDFSGGLSQEEIVNTAYMLIHNIANLRDNLRRWAARNGKDKGKVDATFSASRELQIIQDLSNHDKHGPDRTGGCSGVGPTLQEIGRIMRLSGGEAGSETLVVFGPAGPQVSSTGGSTAAIVITGPVVAKDGTPLGDLFDMELAAVQAWDNLLGEYGVNLMGRA
jgi:hypothetical protein